MEKLTFICLPGLDSYIWDLARELAEEYEVRVTLSDKSAEIRTAVEDADIVWLEWANESAIAALASPGIVHKRVVLRLHSYEAISGYLPLISWAKVNTLVLVAQHMAEICEMLKPGITREVDTVIIPNGIDLVNVPALDPGPGFEIASVGGISHKKNPPLLLQVIRKLAAADQRYRLHVAGAFQEVRCEVYLKHMVREMGLEENVIFYGHVAEMERFWRGKNTLLHASIHEGHCVSIIEALARGIRPVIHNFYGADGQYPGEWLFNTVDEAAAAIREGSGQSGRDYREYVVSRGWTLETQLASVRGMLGEL